MSPEAQRIAIAEACGWKCIQAIGTHSRFEGYNPSTGVLEGLPWYINDLNAMHEAEDTVMTGDPFDGDSLRYRYTSLLYRIVPAERQPCRATAAQRAEAFLRVLGKWTEGEA